MLKLIRNGGVHVGQSHWQHDIHTDKLQFQEYSNTCNVCAVTHCEDPSKTRAPSMLVLKEVDQNGSGTIMATKKSAGVA